MIFVFLIKLPFSVVLRNVYVLMNRLLKSWIAFNWLEISNYHDRSNSPKNLSFLNLKSSSFNHKLIELKLTNQKRLIVRRRQLSRFVQFWCFAKLVFGLKLEINQHLCSYFAHFLSSDDDKQKNTFWNCWILNKHI